MAARHGDLSGTAWAVLGLFSFGHELSGYDLKKWADGSLRFFYWAPASSQIYGELKRLQQLGFVEARVEDSTDLRRRRMFRITDEGTAALREWVEAGDVEPPMLKHNPLLKLWVGHLTEPRHLRQLVEQHREYAVAMADEAAQHVAGAIGRQMPMPELVLEWAERFYRREVESADEMLAELDRMIARSAEPRRPGRR